MLVEDRPASLVVHLVMLSIQGLRRHLVQKAEMGLPLHLVFFQGRNKLYPLAHSREIEIRTNPTSWYLYQLDTIFSKRTDRHYHKWLSNRFAPSKTKSQ